MIARAGGSLTEWVEMGEVLEVVHTIKNVSKGCLPTPRGRQVGPIATDSLNKNDKGSKSLTAWRVTSLVGRLARRPPTSSSRG